MKLLKNMENEEKVLTRDIVKELGLDKLEVITSEMLDGYTSIEKNAFCDCYTLTSITLSNSITIIEDNAFWNCTSLTSITLPNTIISIGYYAFINCYALTTINFQNSISSIAMFAFIKSRNFKNVVIGDKNYEGQTIVNGKSKAYKAFKADLTCRGFQYEEGKTYEIKGEPKLCIRGFHACLNLLDVFNYYCGELGKDIVVHEVELEGVSEETSIDDSKVVAKKIAIGKRIL